MLIIGVTLVLKLSKIISTTTFVYFHLRQLFIKGRSTVARVETPQTTLEGKERKKKKEKERKLAVPVIISLFQPIVISVTFIVLSLVSLQSRAFVILPSLTYGNGNAPYLRPRLRSPGYRIRVTPSLTHLSLAPLVPPRRPQRHPQPASHLLYQIVRSP